MLLFKRMKHMTRLEPLTVFDESLVLVSGSWFIPRPFLQDLEVVGICIASNVSLQLKIVLVEE
jgi:hypothetical protein